jgi:hypothetical protein
MRQDFLKAGEMHRGISMFYSKVKVLFFAAGSVIFCLFLPALAVDFTTLQNKVLFGYQGWFDCPNGGDKWVHWCSGCSNSSPTATNLTVDLYPDLSEFDTTDLCAAGAMTSGGRTSYLFSSHNAAIVNEHFSWMEQYGLDGVLVQRFIGEAPGKRSSGDVVLKNIMAAAVAHGRTFAIEYDLSGGSENTFAQAVQTDWMYMVDSLKATLNPNYLRHNGKPVVSIWGPGLNDGHIPKTPATLASFIQWFKSTAPAKYQAVYIGGTPSGWRTLNSDALTDPGWTPVYNSMDVVQPWTVGRYTDTTTATTWKNTRIIPDLAATNTAGNLYMPVVFPGFSWYNLNKNNTSIGIKNQIPRKGGYFLWKQAYNAKAAGAAMLKIAMFDEVDEGTAMFKVASLRSQAPDQGYWLTLDADGYTLPSDWYLRLAQQITNMFHGTLPPTAAMPMDPAHPLSTFANSGERLPPQLRISRVEGGVLFESRADAARLRIFTPAGKLQRTLVMRNNRVFWDERDAAGNALPSGMYMALAGGGNTAGTCSPIILP